MERKGYAEEQTINYYQVDQKGTLSPAALLSALQNAAIDHSDTLGYTLDYLEELQCGWAVINWHIMVYRMPAHRETIRLETWSNKCRKMQAERGWQRRIPDGFCWTCGLVFPAESGRKILRPMGRRQRGFPWKRREE